MDEMTTMNEFENSEVEVYDETEKSGNGILGLVIGAVVVGAGTVAALAYKNRNKIEEKKIEKLRKKGYVIYKNEELLEGEVEEVETNDAE